MELLYDEETDHFHNRKMQEQWQDKLKKELLAYFNPIVNEV